MLAFAPSPKMIVEVGAVKRDTGVPIYAPHREQAVLRKVLGENAGPLPDKTVEAVYREIMSGSFALEHPLRIGYLGPPGSFSHQAAVKQWVFKPALSSNKPVAVWVEVPLDFHF